MKGSVGTSGLILNEPVLFDKGKTGRRGFSLPRRDIESFPVDEALVGNGPDFPDLREVEEVIH